MTEFPKISIVTPSFNDAIYLERTILSVIRQKYPNLEYIVIDGGSTDGSVDIIKKYEDQVTYWVSEPDQGMYHAIQKGFELSTGDVMGWINSDDVLHFGSLFTVGQLFRDFKLINWLQGIPNVMDEAGRVVQVVNKSEVTRFSFYKKNRDKRKYIQQESTFWRRSLWDQAGGHVSTRFKYAGDFELWIRFFQHASLFNVNALLGSFRVSSGGQASVDNFAAYLAETNAIISAYPLSKKERKKLNRIEHVERLERHLMRILSKIRSVLAAEDDSTIDGSIYFDNRSQCFKFKG